MLMCLVSKLSMLKIPFLSYELRSDNRDQERKKEECEGRGTVCVCRQSIVEKTSFW